LQATCVERYPTRSTADVRGNRRQSANLKKFYRVEGFRLTALAEDARNPLTHGVRK
jgi:hypothetical protein